MLTHIPLIKENVSGTTREESCFMDHNLEDVSDSLMDPNNVAENLSDTLQLCEPFCFTDINSSKSSVVPDMLETNVLVGSFDSISIAEPSELRDNVAKDNATLDSVSEIQSHQNLSRRQSDSSKKTETEKAVRNCRGTSNKKPDLDLLLLKTNRKSRSSPSVRSRSSAWGWGNFAQLLEQNEGIDVNKSERKKSRKPKGSRGHGKQSKTQKNQSLKQLNGEINSNYSTTRIRLKVKMGKQVIQSCVPGTGNDIDKYPQTKLEFPTLTNSVGGRLEDEVSLNTEFQFCYDDVDKDFTEHINGICSRDEVEKFGVTVDNRCLDPGTSPDSEVVNQIPDASISRKLPEDLGNSASFLEQEEKTGDRSYSSEASISDITGVLMETLPSNLKLESPSSGIGVDSPESSEKISSTIPKGRKIPKSSTSKGNGGRQKGTQAKLVNKQKIKEKADGDQIDCKIDCVTKTGNYKLDDCAETKTGFGSTAFDASNLDMVPSGLMSRHVSQRNAWVRCDDCYKWRRIAAVLADSIEETDCKWICKDNKDTYFADCSIPQEKSNSEINAELEISDASCEEDACDARLNSNKLGQKKSKVPQNSSWKLIKSNIFLHRNRKAQTIDEVMVCHCKAPLNGRMGCGDGCLNRLLNIECVKGTCPCGEVCSNQQFQKRKYALLESFRCGRKGHGLRLLEDIPKGGFLIEYVGEVLDTHAYEARQKEYALKGHKHFYFMTLNGSEVIDACAKGNLGRFINHSCEPNCRTEKWMVNGEVCVGLFAMRDIKKGEEVTFDYNYVRVFGAAAKKCVCNSSLCRGYIGGDPDNAELIVQGDSDEEYPEPVMICEDGENNKDKIDKTPTVIQHSEIEITKVAPKPKILLEDKSQSDDFTESEDMKRESSYAAFEPENPMEIEEGLGGLIPCSVRPIEDSGRSESTSISVAEQSISSCTVQRLENSSLDSMIDKSLPDTVDIRKSLKSERELDRCIVSKSHARTKTSRSSSSVKKGKSKNPASNSNKTPEVDSKSNVVVAYKPKKLFEGSSNSTFEAVQVKLNELLDAEGGISRRKDASRGYLKLLFLTAASGDTGNGETIQSTRDLSMILDAILKTKSRSVLVDVINKNGLQMLHNIMKRYRREFKKIPVLRKLLKILEYLASKDILTLEHINRAPPCAGVESFRESILTLTEHTDRQVHQIARKFRDTFIPRSMRKLNCMERDFGRNMEPHQNSNNSRFSAPHNHQSSDQTPKPTTDPIIEPVKQIPTDNNNNNLSSSTTTTSCTTTLNNTPPKTRKRKSRWDQPAESKEPRIKSEPDTSQNLNPTPMDEDVPPGFSPSVSNNDAGPTLEVVMGELQESLISELPVTYGVPLSIGEPQEKFISRLPVSYGIPLSVVQQFGSPNKEVLGDWAVAPGTPFQPFPPLPPYPREKRDPPAENSKGTHHSDPVTPSTSGAGPADFESRGRNNQQSFQRAPLGRKYFRQQKWNNNNNTSNNSKFLPPWVRNRIGTGFMGNNSRNGVCNVGGEIQHHQQPPPFAPQLPPPQGQYGSGEGFVGMEGSENCFYPPPLMPPPMPPQAYHHHQQNWHY